MTTPRSILVLGGTGFIGPPFVEAARSRGHHVTLFNRGQRNPGLFPDVETIHGDREAGLDALEARRWDAVLDTSGFVPRIVATSANRLAPRAGQYVFISSISVYPDDLTVGANEDHPVRILAEPGSEDVQKHYGALKAQCEAAVLAACGGRALIIRPGLIVGPGDPTDRFTYWPVRLDRGGDVLCPGEGADPAQIIDVRDLADWILSCIEREVTGIFNATGPRDPLTMNALLAQCRAGVDAADAHFVWVDADFLARHKVEPWTDLPVWLGAGHALACVDNRRAIDRGLTFRPIAETARDTLAWWKTLPAERRNAPKAGLGTAREADILSSWKAHRVGTATPCEQET